MDSSLVLRPRVFDFQRRTMNINRTEDSFEECLILLEYLLVNHGLRGGSFSKGKCQRKSREFTKNRRGQHGGNPFDMSLTPSLKRFL